MVKTIARLRRAFGRVGADGTGPVFARRISTTLRVGAAIVHAAEIDSASIAVT